MALPALLLSLAIIDDHLKESPLSSLFVPGGDWAEPFVGLRQSAANSAAPATERKVFGHKGLFSEKISWEDSSYAVGEKC